MKINLVSILTVILCCTSLGFAEENEFEISYSVGLISAGYITSNYSSEAVLNPEIKVGKETIKNVWLNLSYGYWSNNADNGNVLLVTDIGVYNYSDNYVGVLAKYTNKNNINICPLFGYSYHMMKRYLVERGMGNFPCTEFKKMKYHSLDVGINFNLNIKENIKLYAEYQRSYFLNSDDKIKINYYKIGLSLYR